MFMLTRTKTYKIRHFGTLEKKHAMQAWLWFQTGPKPWIYQDRN